MREVFIGGSGRSGTSYLHRVVRTTPGFQGVEAELKLLIEAGGLLDLYRSHTRDFNISRSATADRQFPQMVDRLVGSFEWGGDIVLASKDLIAELTWPSGVGRALSPEVADGPFSRFAARVREAICPDPNTVFVEKTPHNSLHPDWLLKLYPNARFVNIVRDPRGVVWSLNEQTWAPDSIQGCTEWLTSYFDALDMQAAVQAPHVSDLILTITLEEVVEHPDRVSRLLSEHLGLPIAIKNPNREAAMRWVDEMPQSDQELVWKALGHRVALHGYEF